MSRKPTLVWLSFASDDGFLGSLVVPPSEGVDELGAFWNTLQRLHQQGLNPGGECLSLGGFTDEGAALVPDAYKNRLLSMDESEALDAILCGEVQ